MSDYHSFHDGDSPLFSSMPDGLPQSSIIGDPDQHFTRIDPIDLNIPGDMLLVSNGDTLFSSSRMQDGMLRDDNVIAVNSQLSQGGLGIDQYLTQTRYEERHFGQSDDCSYGKVYYYTTPDEQNWATGGSEQSFGLSSLPPAVKNLGLVPPQGSASLGNLGQDMREMRSTKVYVLGGHGDDLEDGEGLPMKFAQLESAWTGPTVCHLGGCRRDHQFQTLQTWMSHVKNVHQKHIFCQEAGCPCTRPFASNTDLKRHYKAKHDPIKPFRCHRELCKRKVKAWSRKDKLKDHDSKWHANFRCFLCSENSRHETWFDTPSEFWEHTRSDHPGC